MTKSPSLDSLGELYPGFVVHKMMLRAWRTNADELWAKAFLRLSQTKDFYQRREKDIARETMRILLDLMPSDKRSALSRRLSKR